MLFLRVGVLGEIPQDILEFQSLICSDFTFGQTIIHISTAVINQRATDGTLELNSDSERSAAKILEIVVNRYIFTLRIIGRVFQETGAVFTQTPITDKMLTSSVHVGCATPAAGAPSGASASPMAGCGTNSAGSMTPVRAVVAPTATMAHFRTAGIAAPVKYPCPYRLRFGVHQHDYAGGLIAFADVNRHFMQAGLIALASQLEPRSIPRVVRVCRHPVLINDYGGRYDTALVNRPGDYHRRRCPNLGYRARHHEFHRVRFSVCIGHGAEQDKSVVVLILPVMVFDDGMAYFSRLIRLQYLVDCQNQEIILEFPIISYVCTTLYCQIAAAGRSFGR